MENKSFKVVKDVKFLDCKSLYIRNIGGSCSHSYSLRTFYFYKLISFFKENDFDITIVLRILNRDSRDFWFLFLQTYSIKVYIRLIQSIIDSYKENLRDSDSEIETFNSLITPASFLINYNFINNNSGWYKNYKLFKNFLNTRDVISKEDLKKKLRQPKFSYLNFFKTQGFQTKSNFLIHFIRVQRRYNKRRYSRVRAYSRAPFFAGISLSSTLVVSFWDSSIKLTDWFSSFLINVDVNFIFYLLITYFIFRLIRTMRPSILVRKKGRGRILRYFNTILSRDFFLKLFK